MTVFQLIPRESASVCVVFFVSGQDLNLEVDLIFPILGKEGTNEQVISERKY